MQQQMSMVKYQSHVKDVVPNTTPHKGGPRLRKNRKIENRWGLQYEIAMQYVAFGRQCFPYMPTEPPASLSEKFVECDPLYACRQCKDCFRFQSSFEDHNKRRSWILGIWCHSCFRTVCTHITEVGSTCAICIKKDDDKRSYLRVRGLTKNQKFGAVRVFYNQCQLFEHMKMHRMLSVDVADVMLMPIPIDMTYNDWSTKLEIACEALMEHTFLLRIHIMDWLKKNNVENNWWKLVNDNDDNLIRKIIKGYQGREIFKISEKFGNDEDINSDNMHNINESSLEWNENMEFVGNNSKNIDKNHSANISSDKNVSEYEDNPCLSNDITFIDCGPTSQCLEPELPVKRMPKRSTIVKRSAQESLNLPLLSKTAKTNSRKKNAVLNLIETETCENTITVKANKKGSKKNSVRKQSSKGSVQQWKLVQSVVKETTGNSISKPIIETDVGKIQNNPININFPLPAKQQKLHKANTDNLEQNQQTSTTNCNSKILTVRSSIDADITSIISNLPSHLISNNKKLVFRGQNAQEFITFLSKNEITSEKSSNISISDNNSTNINTSPQKKRRDPIPIRPKPQITNKIVTKDGKKYLIKHLETTIKNPENSSNSSIIINVSKDVKGLTSEHGTLTSSTNISEIENATIEQAAFPHNDITFLTPSPSPSELSSNSSCESYVKQTLITKLRKAPPQLISLDIAPKYIFESISLVKKNGDLHMNIKMSDQMSRLTSRPINDVILKYRQEMIDEFYQLNSFELKKRMDHLQHIREEIKKVMNFISDDVLKEKLRSINIFQRILEECSQKWLMSVQKCNQEEQDEKNDILILNDWEAELKETDLSCKCPSCNKIMKPKSYIPGFSKLPKDDDIYCSCYNRVCHTCLSYQGTLSQFIAHQNFHKNMKPYICPDCYCKFTSAKFLEIHSWTVCFHTLKKRMFACKICDIDGFRDTESIARHFAIMHSDTKVACGDCFKVFPSYNEYIKHYTETHSSIFKQKPIRLVICKLTDEVVRCENYISFLENHLSFYGIRKVVWFKCPFCSLKTLENRHMTAVLNAHLRDKHLHRLSEVLSREALADIFGPEFLVTGSLNSSVDIANDSSLVPKIVNTRTITPEVFERGSHDKNDIWRYTSVNSDTSVPISIATDVNSQRTKKVNDRAGLESLPKILEVRSMADLNATEFKTTTMEILTEAKEAHGSQTSQLEIIKIEDGKGDLLQKHTKETMESDRNTFIDKEETKKIKEPESEKALLSETDNVNSSTELIKTISDSESTSETNISGRIKVIDIRKICKPDIEPIVELCDTQLENRDANNIVSIPKPPPLARIPQHLLEPSEIAVPFKSRNVAKSRSLARKLANKSKCRIAINGPTDTQEECVEFSCHLCNEKINTCSSVVRTHFSEKHPHEYRLSVITPQLVRLSSDFIQTGYKQIISSRKRKSDPFYTYKKKRRWTPKKHTEAKDISTSDVGLCVEQETAEDGEGNYKCKKCDQRCSDMSDLREHIASNHRLKGRYLICLECGENFVVAPSLQMHLKAFHGIEDPISYMSQNPSYAPDINDDLEMEGRTTVANQCYVCMAVFEDKAAVDKHLRVHGMAFLNRKRIEARNALQSPEKKANVEENKQNPKDSTEKTVKRDKPVETILEKLNAAI